MINIPEIRCEGCGKKIDAYGDEYESRFDGKRHMEVQCEHCNYRNKISMYELEQLREEEDEERKLQWEKQRRKLEENYSRFSPSPPLPLIGSPERERIDRENAAHMSLDEYMNRLESWIEYEKDLKEQRVIAETQHRTLTKLFYGLKGFAGGFTENASDSRAIQHNRLVSCARELQQAGILMYKPTPDQLPENERILAKRIISKWL